MSDNVTLFVVFKADVDQTVQALKDFLSARAIYTQFLVLRIRNSIQLVIDKDLAEQLFKMEIKRVPILQGKKGIGASERYHCDTEPQIPQELIDYIASMYIPTPPVYLG